MVGSQLSEKKNVENKAELSTKAKKNFFDNFSKFQNESQQISRDENSNFERSFKSSQEVSVSGERRSLRTNSSQSTKAHHHRQSLREKASDAKTKIAERNSVGKGSQKAIAISVDKKLFISKTNNDVGVARSRTEKSKSVEAGVLECNSSTSTELSSNSQSSATVKRVQNRAEAAMERHKERMRKKAKEDSSVASATALNRSQSISKNKKRNNSTNDKAKDKKFQIVEEKEKDFEKQDLGMNKCEAGDKKGYRSSITKWEAINVIEDTSVFKQTPCKTEDTEDINGFELLNLRSPMIKKKISNRGNMRRSKSNRNVIDRSSGNKLSLVQEAKIEQDVTATKKKVKKQQSPKENDEKEIQIVMMSDVFSNPKVNESPLSNNNFVQYDETHDEKKDDIQVRRNQFALKSGSDKKRLQADSETNILESNTTNTRKKQNFSDDIFSDNHTQKYNIFPEEVTIIQPSFTQLPPNKNDTPESSCNGALKNKTLTGYTSDQQNSTTRDELQKKNLSTLRTGEKRKATAQNASRDDASLVSAAALASEPKVYDTRKTANTVNNSFVSEKIILGSFHQSFSSEPELISISATISEFQKKKGMASTDTLTSKSFRLLSASERRKRLRNVLLKYRNESVEDSPFSEDSDDSASDIDMEWLEKGIDSSDSLDEWLYTPETPTKKETINSVKKDKSLFNNFSNSIRKTQSLRERPRNISSHQVGNERKISEEKIQNEESPEKNSTGNGETSPLMSTVETSPDKENSSQVKSAWEDMENDITEKPKNQLEAEIEEGNTDQTEKENVAIGETKNVGSMLSMWENRSIKQHSGYNAKKDEAFDSSTMGRLKNAKALFQNMSTQKKSSTRQSRYSSTSDENLVKRTSSIKNARSIFEKKQGTSVPKRAASVRVSNISSSYPLPKPRMENEHKAETISTLSSNLCNEKSNNSTGDDLLDDVNSDTEVLSSGNMSENEIDASVKSNEIKVNGNHDVDDELAHITALSASEDM